MKKLSLALSLLIFLAALSRFVGPRKAAGREAPAPIPVSVRPLPAAGEESAGLSASVTKRSGASRPFEFRQTRELALYVSLKKKVFLSEEEKAFKKELLRNRDLLLAVGDFLSRPNTGSGAIDASEKNFALDLLIEALTLPEGRAASERALTALVLDSGVERADLALAVRQELAGTKAEALYQWAALDPSLTGRDLVSRLPGPVSRKIWANVLETQERNRRESGIVGQVDRMGR